MIQAHSRACSLTKADFFARVIRDGKPYWSGRDETNSSTPRTTRDHRNEGIPYIWPTEE